MIRFDNYPYAQFKEAFKTMFGRVGLVVLAALGGSMLGGLTATRSLRGLWEGAIGMPGLSLSSIFSGIGLFVLPLLLVYTIVSVRWEWPLRLTLICTVLMWWNIHKTIRWDLYDSPMAKQEQKLKAQLEQALKESLQKSGTAIPP